MVTISSGSPLAQGFPQISAPVAGPGGRITQPWLQLFIALWNGVLAVQGGNNFIPGDMKLAAYSVVPTSWLLADGSAVYRDKYANLFQAIGVTYGVGNGSTTFNLPNITSTAPANMMWIIHYG